MSSIFDNLSQNSGGYCQDIQASSSTSLLVLIFFAGELSCKTSLARCLFRLSGLAMGDGIEGGRRAEGKGGRSEGRIRDLLDGEERGEIGSRSEY